MSSVNSSSQPSKDELSKLYHSLSLRLNSMEEIIQQMEKTMKQERESMMLGKETKEQGKEKRFQELESTIQDPEDEGEMLIDIYPPKDVENNKSRPKEAGDGEDGALIGHSFIILEFVVSNILLGWTGFWFISLYLVLTYFLSMGPPKYCQSIAELLSIYRFEKENVELVHSAMIRFAVTIYLLYERDSINGFFASLLDSPQTPLD